MSLEDYVLTSNTWEGEVCKFDRFGDVTCVDCVKAEKMRELCAWREGAAHKRSQLYHHRRHAACCMPLQNEWEDAEGGTWVWTQNKLANVCRGNEKRTC